MLQDYMQDLHFDLVVPSLKQARREQVLKQCVVAAAQKIDVKQERLYEYLSEPHRMQRMGAGEGVALADVKVKGLQKPFVMLARLDEEVDFMSSDMRGVRLFAMVLSPLREGPLHLRRVSRVVRLLKNEDLQMRLLEAKDEMQMQSLLVNPEGWMIAA